MESKLTILTPTYNRAATLPKLYESLRSQSIQGFEWFVVDDGSTDQTKELTAAWIREAKFPIRYLYKKNGGKHTALNAGIDQITSELTFIVDSDDWLPEDAVAAILEYHERYGGRPGLCGYSFLRFYPDGTVNEAYYPEDGLVDTYVNARINGGIGGDKAEVFYTEILKRYPFPVYEGEKFLPEDLVWVKMSGPYKMAHINRCIYISDYLEGGLTKSGKRMKLKSPRGMTERARVYLTDPAVNRKTKFKMLLLYHIYGHEAGFHDLELAREIPQKYCFMACKIPALLIRLYWNIRYRQRDKRAIAYQRR